MASSPFQLKPDIRWTEALPHDCETSLAMEHCNQAFGGALLAYVVVEWPAGLDIDDPEVLNVVHDVYQCLYDNPEFRGPFSLLDVLASLPGKRTDLTDRARQLSRVPAKMIHRLVRRDLHRLVVTVHLPDIGAAALLPKLSRLQTELSAKVRPGFDIRLTGTAVVAARNVNSIVTDMGNCLGIEAISVFLLMAVGLRSVLLGVMSMIPNLVPLLVATSILAWTGQPLTLTAAMAFNLCLGLAVDDTIHFLVRFKRELTVDGDARNAVLRTVDHIGTAVIMTTLILIGGFATLGMNSMPAIRTFASLSCATLLAALCADLFLLPAMLLCFFRSSTTTQAESGKPEVDLQASTPPN
jgi:predicted RND superfamily exporter protein